MLKRFVKRLLSCLLLAALFVLVVIGGTLGVQGWRLYRATAAQKPIAGLYDEISSRPGFASCDQLPQTYIDAVISVEDSRLGTTASTRRPLSGRSGPTCAPALWPKAAAP